MYDITEDYIKKILNKEVNVKWNDITPSEYCVEHKVSRADLNIYDKENMEADRLLCHIWATLLQARIVMYKVNKQEQIL